MRGKRNRNRNGKRRRKRKILFKHKYNYFFVVLEGGREAFTLFVFVFSSGWV